jgi:hypothetical protein
MIGELIYVFGILEVCICGGTTLTDRSFIRCLLMSGLNNGYHHTTRNSNYTDIRWNMEAF